jgi:hypothetical protein
MKGKKKDAILETSLGQVTVPGELEGQLTDLERWQGSPEPFIGLSYSTRLWAFYMFDLMGITLMRRSAAAVTRKKSSSDSTAASYLLSTETLRRALRRANDLAPTKAN